MPFNMLGILLGVASLILQGIVIEGGPYIESGLGNRTHAAHELPYFLGGIPKHEETHYYFVEHAAKHIAGGEGLWQATTGEATSFTIHLESEEEEVEEEYPAVDAWNMEDGIFFYVWIANEDQIFTAEVVNNMDGTLTATYESEFPGEYLVYVEAVVLSNHDEGIPIKNSPFSLIIAGDQVVDLNALPTCGATNEHFKEFFWNTGTWVSSNIASMKHGVNRDGWVFQPKTCVYDTFSYDDLMLLASLSEPTWLLVLGGSVQRGLYLTLVDMILAHGAKDEFDSSSITKCWGYADITMGNLRVTYQDMRLWRFRSSEESVECNNEKLVSGSTTAYIHSAKRFLQSEIFQHGHQMPTVIAAPSFLGSEDGASNLAIEVLMNTLPSTWHGTLFMLQHMSGFGYHWQFDNPTRTEGKDVRIHLYGDNPSDDIGLGKLDSYRKEDSRVVFMSTFPMYQAKLFENEYTTNGRRKYGGSQHYHYVVKSSKPEAYSGAKMVQSSITEMISHIILATATGGKAALLEKASSTPDIGQQAPVRPTFELCTDCPAGLLPFHVKSHPEPMCETMASLPGHASNGNVWDDKLCPDWCMATEPVGQTPTGSGLVDVRICEVNDAQ